MPQRTIPAEESTRDLVKAVKNLYSVGSYNDLLLEALAQYDPSEQELAGMSQAEKVNEIVSQHEFPAPMLDGLDLDLDSEKEMADTKEPATT